MSRQLKTQADDVNAMTQLSASVQAANERLERELRNAINESARGGRQELIQTLGTFQQSLVQQSAEATRTQNSQMDAFAQQLALLQKTLSDTLTLQVQQLSEANARRLSEMIPKVHKAGVSLFRISSAMFPLADQVDRNLWDNDEVVSYLKAAGVYV